VLATGIDLDDKEGEFPRMIIASPNGSAITMFQLAGRIARQNTMSHGEMRVIYAAPERDMKSEMKLRERLDLKGKLMKEVFVALKIVGPFTPSEFPCLLYGDFPGSGVCLGGESEVKRILAEKNAYDQTTNNMLSEDRPPADVQDNQKPQSNCLNHPATLPISAHDCVKVERHDAAAADSIQIIGGSVDHDATGPPHLAASSSGQEFAATSDVDEAIDPEFGDIDWTIGCQTYDLSDADPDW
jgi:hypothetical protein